ncbi:hypothetical protein LY78DRAFT_166903 [Colletotrichum sublineola]|nr:hypothetical protein LY78DRAFT_166903 [Colletotrichum sublineola]
MAAACTEVHGCAGKGHRSTDTNKVGLLSESRHASESVEPEGESACMRSVGKVRETRGGRGGTGTQGEGAMWRQSCSEGISRPGIVVVGERHSIRNPCFPYPRRFPSVRHRAAPWRLSVVHHEAKGGEGGCWSTNYGTGDVRVLGVKETLVKFETA